MLTHIKSESQPPKVAKLDGCMVNETKDDTYFRSMSVHYKCSCGHEGPTHVTQAYGMITCLWGICCGCCYNLYTVTHKNKDANCKNSEHKCSNCQKTLAHYKGC